MSISNSVTVVTVLHNNAGLLPQLAETITGLGTGAVIYDSGSSDDSAGAAARLLPGARVVSGENLGFGHGNNIAARQVDTGYILFLNSDARIEAGSLGMLVAHLDENASVAGVQPLIRAWKWPLVTAGSGVYVTPYGEAWDARFMHLERSAGDAVTAPPAVSAAVSLWRTDAFRAVGGFDPGYFMYFEDADLCLRARALGWDFSVLRRASALHMTGASSDRSRASLWELASSVRLARRFLGGGELPRGFLAREARIELVLLRRGKPWIERLRVLSKALGVKVRPVELPPNVLSSLHGKPSDLPLPRPGPSGPGIQGTTIAPYGVFTTSGATVTLRSRGPAVSGGMCDAGGTLRETFFVKAGGAIRLRLLTEGGLSYIFCDRPDSRLEVTYGDIPSQG
ncbi:MAG: glycosyltransferase family 2 protein [Candidatus Fermentibacteraceae bacterium]